jgi:uncharacterized Fe-S cluster protein YjdI
MEMQQEIIRKYTNGKITIVWQPAKCIHLKHCWQELPEVFDPDKRPWVNPLGASTERMIQQINRCTPGALSYYYNDPEKQQPAEKPACREVVAEEILNGPILIFSDLTVKKHNGEIEHKSQPVALCRCGNTKNHPYCDGSHEKANFKG